MENNIGYGGEISLEQLSEMTRQQQMAQNSNVSMTKDGQPAPYVNTTDLTNNKSQDPLGDFTAKLEKERTNLTPPVPGAKVAEPKVYTPPVAPQPAQPKSTKEMSKLDPYDIAPPRINEDAKAVSDFRNKLITDLDNAIERDKQEMWDNVVEPLYQQQLEKKMLAEENGTGDTEEDDVFDIDMSGDTEDNNDVGGFGMNDDVKPTIVMGNTDTTVMQATPVVEVEPLNPQTQDTPHVSVQPTQDNIVAASIDRKDSVMPSKESYDDLTSTDFDELFSTDDDNDDVEDISDDEIKASIAQEIKSKVKTFDNVINLSEFKVSTKATTGSKVLSHLNQVRNTQVGSWALVSAGRPVSMTAMYGDEIEKLNPDPEASPNLTDFQRQKQIFSIFYNHIVDPNKPATFEAWTKTIPAIDIEHLYFCAYRASFGNGSNFLPRRCSNTGCNNGWLEQINPDNMIKYKNEEAKKRVENIMKMDPTNPDLNIKATLYQISDDLCISIKSPTIYSMVFEDVVLNNAFKTKYADLAGWISCIEDIYVIDRNSKQLIKVKCKEEPNNMAKTTNNRYKTYAAILKTLTSDQYIAAVNKINTLQNTYRDDVSFYIPETKCPKCGTAIPADTSVTMVMAFFMRHRLQTATHTSNE